MTDPGAPPQVGRAAASAVEAVERCHAAIDADPRQGIWISHVERSVALARAATVDRRVGAGEELPLAGHTVAVKDNIDVAGLPTTAGCPSYAYAPATSAPAVAALQAGGAVVVGKANLDQFATGLVGTRSPYGTCPNAHWDGLVSGGSSSGSAVAVAAGHATLALGTDTAGSGRVPAAANGIVGVKPTRGRISTLGVVPACRSLDTVSVFAATVADARLAAEVAAAWPTGPDDAWRRDEDRTRRAGAGGAVRIGVPRPGGLTFHGDAAGPARFARALDGLVGALGPAEVVDVDLEPFVAAGALLYGGSLVAERYAAVGAFLEGRPADADPVVSSIILAAAALPAWQVFADQDELRRLAARTVPTWAQVDVLVVPSVPRIPTVAEVAADPIGVNAMLGTYTNFVNLLDLAAVTVPVLAASTDGDAPPPSITLIGPAGSDVLLCDLAGRLA